MTSLKEILVQKTEDYKKAKLIETMLLEHGYRCFVEVDSKYIRIEEMDNHYTLSKEKLNEILELENIEVAKLITEMGKFNIFYIPIPY
ncbi:hypothetical protein [Methanobrevibacter sp.]